MAENEKTRCGDTVNAGPELQRWDELWQLEHRMRQYGRLESVLASALNIAATLYFTLLTNGHDDELAKVQSDPMIKRDVRCLKSLWP